METRTVHSPQGLHSGPDSGPKPAPLIPQAPVSGEVGSRGSGSIAKAPKNLCALKHESWKRDAHVSPARARTSP